MIRAIVNLQARLKACRGVLVDSNVLLDVATNDPAWGDWSARALAQAAEYTTLIINPIIYAEVSVRPLKLWTLFFRQLCISANRYLGRPVSWQGRVSCYTATVAAREPRLCPISTLVRMLRSGVWHSSLAMPHVIGATFRRSRS